MYYVYELVNLMGGVEWVGRTIRPEVRFHEHTKMKPRPKTGHGKFFGRQDISMHIVATYATKAESCQAEFELQKSWGFETDREKHINGNQAKGSKHKLAKLDESKVRQIKSLLVQKVSCAEIARRFGVSALCIGSIKHGKSWKHVK